MSQENRAEARVEREEPIFIEVLSASGARKGDNVTLQCTTRDISPNGLKITTNFPIINNAILELLINLQSGGYKFLLTGEVRWVRKMSEDCYLAGFELIEAEHSDIKQWREMFENEE
jgi:hypothetical protein